MGKGKSKEAAFTAQSSWEKKFFQKKAKPSKKPKTEPKTVKKAIVFSEGVTDVQAVNHLMATSQTEILNNLLPTLTGQAKINAEAFLTVWGYLKDNPPDQPEEDGPAEEELLEFYERESALWG